VVPPAERRSRWGFRASSRPNVHASVRSRGTSAKWRANSDRGWASRCRWGIRGQGTSSTCARGTTARGAACDTLTSAALVAPVEAAWTGSLGTTRGARCGARATTGTGLAALSAKVVGAALSGKVGSWIRLGGRSGFAASRPLGRTVWPPSRAGCSYGRSRCCMWLMLWGQISEARTDRHIGSNSTVHYSRSLSLHFLFFVLSWK